MISNQQKQLINTLGTQRADNSKHTLPASLTNSNNQLLLPIIKELRLHTY